NPPAGGFLSALELWVDFFCKFVKIYKVPYPLEGEMVRKRRPAVTVPQLARVLKIKESVVYGWIKRGLLPVMHLRGYNSKGNFIIKREDAVEIIHIRKRSCTPTKAAELLGICQNSIQYFMRKNIVISTKLMGLTRITLDSIGPAKEFVGKDIVNPELKGFARYSPEKRREVFRKGVELRKNKKRESLERIVIV
ncbi:MAG: hypothetical protein Q8R55_06020, partial [Candidatus Taylorbacteria bacterium]|nr:hypothetical protein [Candidatus Taylorbacteria bacterium]